MRIYDRKQKTLGDIIPYYPASWIQSYISVEIITSKDGDSAKPTGANDILTREQEQLFTSVEPGTEVMINIEYQSENEVTGKNDNGNINYSATVIPETEARYSGGEQRLNDYIKQNAIDKISSDVAGNLVLVMIEFTVNEDGRISDVKISKTSGDANIDGLLLDVVRKMSEWKPAEDARGRKVRQEFELTVSGPEGC